MKKFLSSLLLIAILTSIVFCVPITANASSVVEGAISWAINIANDNSHGYSQSVRWGPDYDCSSFVISAFKSAGVNTGSATYTGNMRNQFTQNGFQWIPWSQIGGTSNLKRGDILLNEKSHTEIYLGNNTNVGAHSNRGYPQQGDQTGTEVSVSGYYYHPWNGVLRYIGGDTCSCSESYAGGYTVTTNSLPLTMRSGHGTNFSTVTSIPKGEQVYVSKSDGSWAHVEWNGYVGFCSMQYLTKIEEKPAPSGYSISVSPSSFYDNEISTVTITPYDSNITNYRLHFIAPDGRITDPDLGNKNYFNFVCRGVYGTWKVYAEITNGNGTFCGSVDNGCVSFDINEVRLGSPADIGTNFYARVGCSGTSTVLTHKDTWSDYTNVYMDNSTLSDNQFFKFVRQSDGSYVISSKKNNNYCLDVNNNSWKSGTNVGMYPSNGSNAQKWNIYYAGNGYYYLRPFDYNSAMLDVEGASSENGANVQLYTFNATDAQKFSITKVTDTTIPTGSISSTNNVSSTQTVTLSLSDNKGLVGYYWGTNSNYLNNKYVLNISSKVTETVSSAGTYYLTVKDTSGNLSNTSSITFYKTTLDANGGSVSPSNVLTKSGDSFTLPTPLRSGYTFKGWGTSSSSTSGIKSLSPTSNKTYYAIWDKTTSLTANTSNTAMISNAGEIRYYTYTPSLTEKYVIYSTGSEDTTVYLYDSSGTELANNDDSGEGRNFRLEYDLVAGVQYKYGIKYWSSTNTGSIAFKFGKIFTVSYNGNGGSGVPSSQRKDYGTDIVISSTTPTRNGYEFLGWSTSSVATSATYKAGDNYAINASNTLYAVWKDTTKPAATISSTKNIASTQTVTLNLTDNVGVTSYYWGTSSSPTSNLYNSITSTTNKTITKTVSSAGTYYLIAKDNIGNISATQSITFYKTTLDANGGSVSPSSVLTKSDDSFTLPTPLRSGYTFKGWGTSSSSTSGIKSLNPTSNRTYYAIWADDLAHMLLGDINGDNAININDATEIQKYIAELIELSDKQKAVADTNGDGDVNINDATQIQKYIAELIPKLG